MKTSSRSFHLTLWMFLLVDGRHFNRSGLTCFEQPTEGGFRNSCDTNDSTTVKEVVELFTEYLCKEATRTIVHWKSKTVAIKGIDKWNRFGVHAYVVDPNKPTEWTKYSEHYSERGVPYVKVQDLKPNTTYHFGIFVKTETSAEPMEIFTEVPFQTLAEDYTRISVVGNSGVSSFMPLSGEQASATFTWAPVPENVCSYEIVVVNLNATFGEQPQHFFTKAQQVNQTVISHLKFGCRFSIAVYGANIRAEGTKLWTSFQVPNCFDFHDGNNNVCSPLPVENVSISIRDCKLNIKWRKAQRPPLEYQITILPTNPRRINATINETISGDLNEFNGMTQHLGEYGRIFLFARSVAGEGPTFSEDFENHCGPVANSTHSSQLLVITACLAFTVLILVGFCVARFYKGQKMETTVPAQKPEVPQAHSDKPEDADKQDPPTEDIEEDAGEFEVTRKSLHLQEVVGEGEFGVVRRAYYYDRMGKREVAVKMLRDDASDDDTKQLKLELEVMKSVGSHNNIVCLVGFCSSSHMLVVEYCSVGNLQNYLRDIWRANNYARAEYDRQSVVFEPEKHKVVNNFLYYRTDMEKKLLKVTVSDLISLARQVALGMEYLSSKRVVHRDLAARNILLNGNLTAKISDFGLSRDVYEENMYRHKGARRLPVKWMAIECLVHQMFTTQSDVYAIMYECWNSIPHQRPTFTQLVGRLEELLQNDEEHKYLKLDDVDTVFTSVLYAGIVRQFHKYVTSWIQAYIH